MGGRLGVGEAGFGGAAFWFEARFEPAGPQSRAASLAGRAIAVASPCAIVREAAARQIISSGGTAAPSPTLAEAIAATRPGAVVLVDHLISAGAEPVSPPPGRSSLVLLRPGERERIAPYRKAGFDGYLIKPLRRASLVERILAIGEAHAGDDDRVAFGPAGRAPTAGGARVLLAEDNPINAMLARTLLRREGAEVCCVTSGEAALEAMAADAFDLVLMDVRMPGVGGIEAARRLRARRDETPIVALTADAFEDDRRACFDAGMDDFLVKPLSPEALRLALSRWAGAARRVRQPALES
jgi:CheY-like chemotaxis protein